MSTEGTDSAEIFRSVFDAMPSLIFVVDADVRIQEYNAAAAELLLGKRETILKSRGGEALNCIHLKEASGRCGGTPSCKDCVIRASVTEAFQGNSVVRRRTRIQIDRDHDKVEIFAFVTATPFRFKERPFVLLVIEDISELMEIKRIIPICSICKEVRDKKETWSQLEAYFKKNWDVDFSHGLCPKCLKSEMEKIKNEFRQDACDMSGI